jgi:hypothetical protein
MPKPIAEKWTLPSKWREQRGRPAARSTGR